MKDALKRFAETRPEQACWAQCHAPYESMYFGTRGEVIACCYNRANPLGHYPKQSLRQIWDGKAARAMREGMMSDNSLPEGCHLCASQVMADNFGGLHAAQYDQYAGEPPAPPEGLLRRVLTRRDKTYPKLMEFELSNSCNLECVMCHGGFSSSIRKNREGLPPIENPYDERFAKQLEEFIPHLEDAKFLGGEPFLVGVYYDIWDRIIKLNPECVNHITTNGSIMNPRIRKTMEALGRVEITMSIDSLVRETYDKIRINSDYDKVRKSIEYYAKVCRAKGRWLGFATCPMTLNWKEMPDLVRYCNEHEHTIYFNTVVFPRFVSLRHQPSDQLAKIVDVYRAVDLPTGHWLLDCNRKAFEDLTNQIESWRLEALRREETPSTCEAFLWRTRTRDKIRAVPIVSEMETVIAGELARPDATPETGRELAHSLYKRYLKAPEKLKEVNHTGPRPSGVTPEDLAFVRDYTYAVWLAWSGHERLNAEDEAELRIKLELLYQHYQNFSDKTGYLEMMLDSNLRSFVEALQEKDYDELLYAPASVFEARATSSAG